jgi:transglutaminase-like putative cysteine protease
MNSLTQHCGLDQFGQAYRRMLENDAHAPGSVDRVLAERMVRLCAETADFLYREFTPTRVVYRAGSRPKLELCIAAACAGRGPGMERAAAIAEFCAALGRRASDNLDAMRVGGTEEDIIERGSDWCTDVARVGCVLCQIARFPARLVMLADTARAYSGHAIIETWAGGLWGAVDTQTAVVYRHPDGQPASIWELMNQPGLVAAHGKGQATPYSTADQFRCAAIVNYFVEDSASFNYTVSGVNEYYRSILTMSARGWPGGLRWLYGEDRKVSAAQAEQLRTSHEDTLKL